MVKFLNLKNESIPMEYEAVIGLEIHAELNTASKMFCSCPVVDSVQAAPNSAVCPVCAGMPGVLPVVNRQAVARGAKVALALECSVARTSLFDRKNYFYPDLPKGYQISQYEYPLAQHGQLTISTSQGERVIRVRRVHLEEDTGKLTHVHNGQEYSLVDLNRAGVPLLEIVSEPDMHTAEEAVAYGAAIRGIVRALGVNSGDMEKGVIRFEANISIRPKGSDVLGTRTEVKNLNSFRAMERAIEYEIRRQAAVLDAGGTVRQETLGWDEPNGKTFSQRSKEEAHDYRYFPEPDLPPLVVEPAWVAEIAATLPELPRARVLRFERDYELSRADALLLGSEQESAQYFEAAAAAAVAQNVPPRTIANWMLGEVNGWMNQSGERLDQIRVSPAQLVELAAMVAQGEINLPTAKTVLADMLVSGKTAPQIAAERGLKQISDSSFIADLVREVLEANAAELNAYLGGKETLSNWFFGQVMRAAKGQANPTVLRAELEKQLTGRKG